MTDPALQNYIEKWLATTPAQRVSLPFVTSPHRDTFIALAALEQELIRSTYGTSTTAIAETKLNWWVEELAGAYTSGGRHPLVQALFRDERVSGSPSRLWLKPVTAAMQQIDLGTAPDFNTQLERAGAFHGALAALETHIWFGPDADPAKAARIATLSHLLQALTFLTEAVEAERLPLPMACLARHELDRSGLANDSKARRDAVRTQLASLHEAWKEIDKLPGPTSVFRGVDDRLGRTWVKHARHAKAPLASLHRVQKRQTGFRVLWRAWSAARASRRAGNID